MGIGELSWKIREQAREFSLKALELAKANRIAVFVCSGALGVIFVLLVILAVSRHLPAKVSKPADASGAFAPLVFSPEDFFMPGEPDFVPGVILEREPRDGWSEEDARPFWTDPLEGNAGIWRERIESEIDKLLERVP